MFSLDGTDVSNQMFHFSDGCLYSESYDESHSCKLQVREPVLLNLVLRIMLYPKNGVLISVDPQWQKKPKKMPTDITVPLVYFNSSMQDNSRKTSQLR